MAYATVDNYTEWLQGRVPTVPLAEFPFWATRASSEIDFLTFNRLHNTEVLTEFQADVIKTTCELAGVIYNDESPDGKKELSGYSIGGYSESYVSSESKTPQGRITAAIRWGLGLTGLLYRG